MHRLIIIFLLLSAGITSAAPKLPREVLNYIDTRDGCDHFRGEPWDDGDEYKDRRDFIFARINEYCKGTDKQLAKLRHKYRKSAPVIESLRKYVDKIER